MKRGTKVIAGTVMGLGVGMGVGAGFDALITSTYSEQVQPKELIVTCAPALGQLAVHSESLPKGCEAAAYYIPHTIKNKSRVDHDSVEIIEESIDYELPSRDDFVTEMKSHQTQDVDYRINRGKKFSAGIGLLYGLGTYYITHKILSRKRKSLNGDARSSEAPDLQADINRDRL